MQIVSTTTMRKNMSEVINTLQNKGGVLGVGRRNKIEVLVIKCPEYLNKEINDISNFNANFGSFDFLKNEPDLYSLDDLKKRYV